MPKVRSKFVCTGIENHPEYNQKNVSLSPVISGSEENKSFSKYTPSGIIQLAISDETEAANHFTQGKEYYVDFTAAEENEQ